MGKKISIFWFRRDLRFEDNTGLIKALNEEYPVLPIFIFDTEILDRLPKNDPRVTFIYSTLQSLRRKLQNLCGGSIALYSGYPEKVFLHLIKDYTVQCVFANEDYEPYAKTRDNTVQSLLAKNDIPFRTYKDQVVFAKNEVAKSGGDPYVVYTPYKKKWKEIFDPEIHLKTQNIVPEMYNFLKDPQLPNLTLEDIGFEMSPIKVTDYDTTSHLIGNYEKTRNFPGKTQGTSRLGPHLRFGTVSIRQIMQKAIAEENQTFWNELLWREFFMQILWHFPTTVKNSFKPKYDRIEWRNNETEFELWKNGQTGYALVDAGMRELNHTGYMHNRVRMLTASFLCKHLLIDWRWGEAYFAEKLLDYDQSANVGNWQWAAGSGVDAAPYFRIFNPVTQVEKFDGQKQYITQWVPELRELTYGTKIIDHKLARERCLKVYKEALGY